jgi:hypothetical protein
LRSCLREITHKYILFRPLTDDKGSTAVTGGADVERSSHISLRL